MAGDEDDDPRVPQTSELSPEVVDAARSEVVRRRQGLLEAQREAARTRNRLQNMLRKLRKSLFGDEDE